MALNWDAFLNNESLDVPNEQWSDLSAPPTGLSTSDMPKTISSQTSGSTPVYTSAFDSLLSGTSTDPYFHDSVFISNDYFLSDLEVLQPFGSIVGGESTTESSPEPTTGPTDFTSYHISSVSPASNLPLPMAPSQRPSINRANTFPNPTYESMFPNNMDAGFVEDITFPDGLKEASVSSSRPSMERNKTSTSTTTVKRNKNQPDSLSACWTSPLCPNHDTDGPPPNPSTCGGGCGPFLFAEDNLPTPTIKNPLSEPKEITAEDGIVEIQPRPKKRSESETSATEPSGRLFSTMDSAAVLAEARQRMKSETSEDSPIHGSPPAADDKPKSRRRLPHNQVERKYRESLNTQLDSLRRVVPSLQQNGRACDGADIEDLPAPSKPSKAVILASATAHIKQQEKDKKSLAEENALLRARVKALQALVKCDDCSLMQYVMDMKIHQAK